MNIAQAKQIPLQKLVEHFGGKFSHSRKPHETWWYSPFRPEERTASFKIDEKTNKWHDFARIEKHDAHGDILDLWTDFNNLSRRDSDAIKQALQALKSFGGSVSAIDKKPYDTNLEHQTHRAQPEEHTRYKLVKQPSRIWMDSLKQEIGRHGLSLVTVQDSLKQVSILDTKTKKTYNGFAFENDKGGYEISIPNPKKGESFKTTIKPKGITCYLPDRCTSVCVYEGFWDFYTWVHVNKGLGNDGHIILNSTTNAYEAMQKLIARKETVTHVFLFMDNDKTGEKALHQIASELEPHGFAIGSMNHLYEDYKDLNEAWIKEKNSNKITNRKITKVSYDTAWNTIKKDLLNKF